VITRSSGWSDIGPNGRRYVTDRAGPPARRREQFDIAAHALRIRTRTGGGEVLGSLALTTAP
jgi:hypothetical protein